MVHRTDRCSWSNNSADISGALVTRDNVTITADNKEFAIQNGSAVDKFTVDTDNGARYSWNPDVGGDVTAESNLTVTGNLTVNGTTTTVNSTVTTIDDPIITVGGDTAPRLTMVRIMVLNSVVTTALLKLLLRIRQFLTNSLS